MCKDIIISLLSAVIISDLPCFEIGSFDEKLVMIVGIATAVFIFCLFCEDLYEKWQNRRKRVLKMEEIVRKLRFSPMGKEEQ